MAHKSKQRESNLAQVQAFLEDIGLYLIDEGTADIYGQFKAEIISRFGPNTLLWCGAINGSPFTIKTSAQPINSFRSELISVPQARAKNGIQVKPRQEPTLLN